MEVNIDRNCRKEVADEDSDEDVIPRKTILCMKKAMQELITPLEEKINQLLDTKEKQEAQEEEIGKLKIRQSELYRRCLKAETENCKLKERIEQLENTMLESNLIMHGLREEEWELEEDRRERIYHAIASMVDADNRRTRVDIARSIPIRSTKRIGKYKTGKNHPISTVFERKSHAEVLYESKSWLPHGVFIDKQYTEDVENQRKLLRLILKLARSIEHYHGKCKLEDNYLVIHGKKYGTKDLHKLPNDLSGFHASSKQDEKNGIHTFFGELSPFSNFHPAKFSIDGTSYTSSEQYIQNQKALLFDDVDTSDRIMISTTLLECKDLGRCVKGFKEEIWHDQAKSLCYPGLLAKFQSNTYLKEMLLSTGRSQIVEATYDMMWGTGIPLQSKDCLVRKHWKSTGLLGKILMRIRDNKLTTASN